MLLTPYRVLDLTGPLGFLAGKVLADLGADVIKVEPPGGDPSRCWPPVAVDRDGGERSLFWMALNAGKRGVTLDLESAAGQFALGQLVRHADFVIESFPPGFLDARGLGYERLRAERDGLIMVSITPFGQQGPYRDLIASDLEIMALSGAMSLAGERDGEPLRVTAPQALMWAGVEAAMGALTALAFRTRTGRGQWVDVSAQVAVMAALAHAPVFWDMNRVNPTRDGIYVTGRSVTGARMRAFWPCRDGWINFIIYGGSAGRHTNQQLVAWMEACGFATPSLLKIDWARFTVPTLTQTEVEEIEAPIARFFATLTKREFLDGSCRREMLGYPVFTVEDIHHDPQLEAREFWQEVAARGFDAPLRFPGGFAIVNGERLPVARHAPAVGEHNDEVFSHLLENSHVQS